MTLLVSTRIAQFRCAITVSPQKAESLFGLADQTLISVSNFLTFLFIARAVGGAALGAFSLTFSMLLIATSLQNAIVIAPHAVLGANLSLAQFRALTTSLTLVQIPLSAILSLAVITVGYTIDLNANASHLLLLTGILCFLTLLQEFPRRILYIQGRSRDALASDTMNYGYQVLGIGQLYLAHSLTVSTALAVMAYTTGLSAAWALAVSRRYFCPAAARESALQWLRPAWRYGRWLLFTSVAGAVSSQAYAFLGAALVGLPAVGALRAAQVLLGPTNIIFRFIDTSLTPRVVRIFANSGEASLISFIARLRALLFIPFAALVVIVSVSSSSIFHLLYGDSSPEDSWILLPVACATFISMLSATAGLALKAQSRSLPGLAAQICASAFTLSAGLLLTERFAMSGVAASLVVSSAIIWIVQEVSFRNPRRASRRAERLA